MNLLIDALHELGSVTETEWKVDSINFKTLIDEIK